MMWVRIRNPQADIRFGKNTYLGPGFSLHMPRGGTFIAGSGVEFRRNFRCDVDADARVTIADRTKFTYDVLIQCGKSIEIGERVMIAQSTLIVDGSHRFRELERPILAQGYDLRPLRIGDGAAVMSKCTIINDVGHRAFVGANSVVSRPVPAYCVAVGAPARAIEYYGPPGNEPPDLEPLEGARSED
jgi:acetyltransferase-like isoleucine patch superfamily enzyme